MKLYVVVVGMMFEGGGIVGFTTDIEAAKEVAKEELEDWLGRPVKLEWREARPVDVRIKGPVKVTHALAAYVDSSYFAEVWEVEVEEQ